MHCSRCSAQCQQPWGSLSRRLRLGVPVRWAPQLLMVPYDLGDAVLDTVVLFKVPLAGLEGTRRKRGSAACPADM